MSHSINWNWSRRTHKYLISISVTNLPPTNLHADIFNFLCWTRKRETWKTPLLFEGQGIAVDWSNNPSRIWESDLLGDQYNKVVSHSSYGTVQCDMVPNRNFTKFILTSSVEKSRRRSPCFLLLRSPAYRPNLNKLRLSGTKERLDRKHPKKEDWLSLLAHRKAAMLILHTDTQESRVHSFRKGLETNKFSRYSCPG